MALTQADKAAIAEIVALAIASIPAAPVAAARTAKPRETFAKVHACTATPACTRVDFRTAKRAATHGVDAGGHTPR